MHAHTLQGLPLLFPRVSQRELQIQVNEKEKAPKEKIANKIIKVIMCPNTCNIQSGSITLCCGTIYPLYIHSTYKSLNMFKSQQKKI